ncbi:MAG TPA: DNA polymerase III subunit gamma/tau [Candidatus Saccharimonadales bacterium]|nr:DNA polymerase III subunit gamma/tau [Candidatus Saccharimonadales bacterium]
MGQALYRKHRPKKLADVVGQEHITTTLGHALKSGRISHAYLFVGPRGVGKTSIARILAHEINQLPYTDDSVHFDIIEIDAASNRRIDEIRDLRDKVHIAPTSAKYKVYIIDEVHMLTKEAFNALLKTLEEPPAHVVFILATTEAHKLPETIVSRTQRFTFRPIDRQKIIDHLRTIAKEEGIQVSDEALALIAEHGEGSFRDSISLLDQAGNQKGSVELTDVETLLGIPPRTAVDTLINTLAKPPVDIAQLMGEISSLYASGFQATLIAKQLSEALRADMLASQPRLPRHATLQLLAQLLEVPASNQPDRLLELVLLQSVATPASESTPTPPTSPEPPVPSPTTQEPEKPEPMPTPPKAPTKREKASAAATVTPAPAVAKGAGTVLDAALWPQVIDSLKKQYNTVYGIVRNAQVAFPEPNIVELTFAFGFHQKRIADAKNSKILTDIIYELTHQHVQLRCLHDKASSPTPLTAAAEPKKPTSNNFSAISNIFGGGELLES